MYFVVLLNSNLNYHLWRMPLRRRSRTCQQRKPNVKFGHSIEVASMVGEVEMKTDQYRSYIYNVERQI